MHDKLSHLYNTDCDSRLRHRSANSSVSDLANSFESKVSIQPIVIQPPPKKQKKTSKSFQDEYTNFVGTKSTITKPTKFGINKGVSHAIKKPKHQKQVKKASPEKRTNKPDDNDDDAGSANEIEEAEASYECGALDCTHPGRFNSQRELEEHWESNLECAMAQF